MCGDYLEAYDGKFVNSNLSALDKERTAPLVAHNNHAKRPYAVIKSMAKLYPSTRLEALSHLARARLNGTFKIVGKEPTALFGTMDRRPRLASGFIRKSTFSTGKIANKLKRFFLTSVGSKNNAEAWASVLKNSRSYSVLTF